MLSEATHLQYLVANKQMHTLRCALSNVCHSERSEESALVRLGPELQILREVYPEGANCRPFGSLRVAAKASGQDIRVGLRFRRS